MAFKAPAVEIQRVWRGYAGRKVFAKIQMNKEREKRRPKKVKPIIKSFNNTVKSDLSATIHPPSQGIQVQGINHDENEIDPSKIVVFKAIKKKTKDSVSKDKREEVKVNPVVHMSSLMVSQPKIDLLGFDGGLHAIEEESDTLLDSLTTGLKPLVLDEDSLDGCDRIVDSLEGIADSLDVDKKTDYCDDDSLNGDSDYSYLDIKQLEDNSDDDDDMKLLQFSVKNNKSSHVIQRSPPKPELSKPIVKPTKPMMNVKLPEETDASEQFAEDLSGIDRSPKFQSQKRVAMSARTKIPKRSSTNRSNLLSAPANRVNKPTFSNVDPTPAASTTRITGILPYSPTVSVGENSEGTPVGSPLIQQDQPRQRVPHNKPTVSDLLAVAPTDQSMESFFPVKNTPNSEPQDNKALVQMDRALALYQKNVRNNIPQQKVNDDDNSDARPIRQPLPPSVSPSRKPPPSNRARQQIETNQPDIHRSPPPLQQQQERIINRQQKYRDGYSHHQQDYGHQNHQNTPQYGAPPQENYQHQHQQQQSSSYQQNYHMENNGINRNNNQKQPPPQASPQRKPKEGKMASPSKQQRRKDIGNGQLSQTRLSQEEEKILLLEIERLNAIQQQKKSELDYLALKQQAMDKKNGNHPNEVQQGVPLRQNQRQNPGYPVKRVRQPNSPAKPSPREGLSMPSQVKNRLNHEEKKNHNQQGQKPKKDSADPEKEKEKRAFKWGAKDVKGKENGLFGSPQRVGKERKNLKKQLQQQERIRSAGSSSSRARPSDQYERYENKHNGNDSPDYYSQQEHYQQSPIQQRRIEEWSAAVHQERNRRLGDNNSLNGKQGGGRTPIRRDVRHEPEVVAALAAIDSGGGYLKEYQKKTRVRSNSNPRLNRRNMQEGSYADDGSSVGGPYSVGSNGPRSVKKGRVAAKQGRRQVEETISLPPLPSSSQGRRNSMNDAGPMSGGAEVQEAFVHPLAGKSRRVSSRSSTLSAPSRITEPGEYIFPKPGKCK